MKKYLLILLLISTISSQAQSPIGVWKTIDDETGKPKAEITIEEKNGKLFGTITNLLIKPESTICSVCPGSKKNKPILGLIILENLTQDGTEWSGGSILDPKTGKIYKCYITLESSNKLKVRGYVGFSLIGRTQNWVRVK